MAVTVVLCSQSARTKGSDVMPTMGMLAAPDRLDLYTYTGWSGLIALYRDQQGNI